MLSPFVPYPSVSISDEQALISILALLVLLIVKEIATGLKTPRARILDRILLIPIGPLMAIFLATAISKLGQVLHF